MLMRSKVRQLLGYRYDYKVDDEIVGSVWVDKQRHNRLYVWDVYIEPKYRGKGYGEEVMKALIQLYADWIVYLRVRFENDVALKLYLKLGFRETEWNMNFITMERIGDKYGSGEEL